MRINWDNFLEFGWLSTPLIALGPDGPPATTDSGRFLVDIVPNNFDIPSDAPSLDGSSVGLE